MNPLSLPFPVLAASLLGVALVAPPAAAQSDLKVTFPTVSDSRTRDRQDNKWGLLTLHGKVEGAGLERAKAFRIAVASAKDDLGNVLAPESDAAPDWGDGPTSMSLWVKLKGLAREASTVTLAGRLEAWVPSMDPASEVKVEKAFATAGKPVVSPGLKAANVEILVIPLERVSENSVVLVGWTEQLERVREIKVVRADGTAIEVHGRSSSSDGQQKQIELSLGEQPTPDAGLVFSILTPKAVVSVPFETGITLP